MKTVLLVIFLCSVFLGCGVLLGSAPAPVQKPNPEPPAKKVMKQRRNEDIELEKYLKRLEHFRPYDDRFVRRYQGYNIAYEVLRTRYILEYILDKNPNIIRPTEKEINDYMGKNVTEDFMRIQEDDPEHPRNDPDDE